MIYILQVTKHGKNKITKKFDLSSAKKFLYGLSPGNFRFNDYYLSATDQEFELQEIRTFFNSKYIQEVLFEGFSMYHINPKIPKKKRILRNGATIKSLQKFKDKIQAEIPNSKVDMTFEANNFVITVEQPPITFKAICTYTLIIETWWGTDGDSKFVNIEQGNEIFKTINRLFVKQRYYYKKKENKNGKS